jgi:hypothetical protein
MTAKKRSTKPAAKPKAAPKLANRKATGADVVAAMALLRDRVAEAEERHDREAARVAGLQEQATRVAGLLALPTGAGWPEVEARLAATLRVAVLGSPTVAEAGVAVTRLRERVAVAERVRDQTRIELRATTAALGLETQRRVDAEGRAGRSAALGWELGAMDERAECAAVVKGRAKAPVPSDDSIWFEERLAVAEALLAAAKTIRERPEPKAPRPSFNHTRADGPADPCPECLSLMRPPEVAAFVTDLRDQLADERTERKAAEEKFAGATEAAALRVEAVLDGMHAEHLGDDQGSTGPDYCPDTCWACALMALPAAARDLSVPSGTVFPPYETLAQLRPDVPSPAIAALNTLARWRYDVDDLIGENVADVRGVAQAALTACGLPIPPEGPAASAHEDRPRATRAAIEDAQMDRVLARRSASEPPLPPALPLRHADAPGTVLGCDPTCALDCPECGPGCEHCGPGDAHFDTCPHGPCVGCGRPETLEKDCPRCAWGMDGGPEPLGTGEVFDLAAEAHAAQAEAEVERLRGRVLVRDLLERACPGCSAGLVAVPGGAKCGACGAFVPGGGGA